MDFDDTTDHYKSASALFSVTFDGTTTDDISVHALHTIRDMLAGYDTYIDTEVGVDTSADLQSEMSVILVLAPSSSCWCLPLRPVPMPRFRF